VTSDFCPTDLAIESKNVEAEGVEHFFFFWGWIFFFFFFLGVEYLIQVLPDREKRNQ
jgi:hypothetical protein